MLGAEELLRASVKALKGKRTQRSLAKAIGVSDTNMSDFLAGKQGLGLDKLAPLAKELGKPIYELFLVRKSDAASGPVTPVRSESTSTETPGDADGTQARLLEEHTRLTKENAALRVAVNELADQYKRLAAVVKARPAQGGKSHRRRSR